MLFSKDIAVGYDLFYFDAVCETTRCTNKMMTKILPPSESGDKKRRSVSLMKYPAKVFMEVKR